MLVSHLVYYSLLTLYRMQSQTVMRLIVAWQPRIGSMWVGMPCQKCMKKSCTCGFEQSHVFINTVKYLHQYHIQINRNQYGHQFLIWYIHIKKWQLYDLQGNCLVIVTIIATTAHLLKICPHDSIQHPLTMSLVHDHKCLKLYGVESRVSEDQ